MFKHELQTKARTLVIYILIVALDLFRAVFLVLSRAEVIKFCGKCVCDRTERQIEAEIFFFSAN